MKSGASGLQNDALIKENGSIVTPEDALCKLRSASISSHSHPTSAGTLCYGENTWQQTPFKYSRKHRTAYYIRHLNRLHI
jgi:hypothetical protein